VAIEAFKIVDNLSADMLGKMDERIKSVLGALKEISGVEEGVLYGVEPCEEPLWCDVKDARSM
jgi:hypothetical protein